MLLTQMKIKYTNAIFLCKRENQSVKSTLKNANHVTNKV